LNSDKEILTLIDDDRHFDRGFRMLVEKYKERMYWQVRRMVHFHEDADDVLQNVFIKVFKNIKNFNSDSKLYTWLYRICCNESISYLKKKNSGLESSSEIVELLGRKLKADVYFNEDNALLNLKKAIASLPAKQQLVFNLRYYDELNYKDISEILGTTIGALKASYHHAVKKVEHFLKINSEHV